MGFVTGSHHKKQRIILTTMKAKLHDLVMGILKTIQYSPIFLNYPSMKTSLHTDAIIQTKVLILKDTHSTATANHCFIRLYSVVIDENGKRLNVMGQNKLSVKHNKNLFKRLLLQNVYKHSSLMITKDEDMTTFEFNSANLVWLADESTLLVNSNYLYPKKAFEEKISNILTEAGCSSKHLHYIIKFDQY